MVCGHPMGCGLPCGHSMGPWGAPTLASCGLHMVWGHPIDCGHPMGLRPSNGPTAIQWAYGHGLRRPHGFVGCGTPLHPTARPAAARRRRRRPPAAQCRRPAAPLPPLLSAGPLPGAARQGPPRRPTRLRRLAAATTHHSTAPMSGQNAVSRASAMWTTLRRRPHPLRSRALWSGARIRTSGFGSARRWRLSSAGQAHMLGPK